MSNLPKGWIEKKLGEICTITSSKRIFQSEYTPSGIPFYRTKEIKELANDKDVTTELFISEERYKEIKVNFGIPIEGDMLLTAIGTIGEIYIVEKDKEFYFKDGNVLWLKDFKSVNTYYLKFALRIFIEQIKKLSNGSTYNALPIEKLKNHKISLPPLEEQKRIAEILDQAEELRTKRRDAIAQLNTLNQSIFLEMFGDPVTNLKGWDKKFIKDIGQVITGNTPSRANTEFYGDAIEWIKSDNINTPLDYLTQAEEGLSELGKSVSRIAPSGSILVTCIAGTPSCIGNAAIANRDVAFNQQINALVPFTYNVKFVYTQILVAKKLIQEASTASMKGMVSKSRFEEIRFICPPLQLQKEFSHRVEAVESLKAAHRASLSELDALFASLQHRAFRGEL
ncbi:restriction endonuclease subunit S [Trichormus sp. NMC-1]|uniref:restriction endonuclease subunit S n=1 Tax=Trichormus sp. NMC-1 TaxID=1853259 RepID=UPI000A98F864|nr:restriction endonuclease subunit S [Trichormus sp. NMC-1]